MNVRPMPCARAPGVAKFHWRLGKTSSLVCADAAAGMASPKRNRPTAIRHMGNLISDSSFDALPLAVHDLRDFVLRHEPGNGPALLLRAAADDGDIELDGASVVGIAGAHVVFALRQRDQAR